MPDRKPRKPAPNRAAPDTSAGRIRQSPVLPLPRAGEGRGEGRTDTLARAAAYLQNGQPTLALPLLLPELDARASSGDTACALAAAALRLSPPDPSPIPPDALSATVGRLVALVRQQDEQIRTLRALIEDTL